MRERGREAEELCFQGTKNDNLCIKMLIIFLPCVQGKRDHSLDRFEPIWMQQEGETTQKREGKKRHI